eukprot:gnl/Dysnectes_brevis/5726_a8417_414.p1 GENE.gnl/Dysnectes_brevis/5726_a8417_414~~gnl/Dysnectes_brevis/5726_a8417_414.p1  ORF type:complete len:297 (+),score=13.82 gnl/Dysnectes_brevis/5726_a8417_414:75-965(+)
MMGLFLPDEYDEYDYELDHMSDLSLFKMPVDDFSHLNRSFMRGKDITMNLAPPKRRVSFAPTCKIHIETEVDNWILIDRCLSLSQSQSLSQEDQLFFKPRKLVKKAKQGSILARTLKDIQDGHITNPLFLFPLHRNDTLPIPKNFKEHLKDILTIKFITNQAPLLLYGDPFQDLCSFFPHETPTEPNPGHTSSGASLDDMAGRPFHYKTLTEADWKIVVPRPPREPHCFRRILTTRAPFVLPRSRARPRSRRPPRLPVPAPPPQRVGVLVPGSERLQGFMGSRKWQPRKLKFVSRK